MCEEVGSPSQNNFWTFIMPAHGNLGFLSFKGEKFI